MSQQIELLTKLKNYLVEFLDVLIESFPKETDFVIFRIFIKDQLPITDIMNYIVEGLCPHEKYVMERNEKLFLENNILFEKFDTKKMNKVNHFKNLWTSADVSESDKKFIWDWFALFISIGNNYKKLTAGK